MRVLLTGGTGFIGREVVKELAGAGHSVEIVGRSGPQPEAIAEADAVVNLAGEPVAQRWTAAAKRRILDSRVDSTRKLVEGIAAVAHKPTVLISASAIGYYGAGTEPITETAGPGTGFLAEVCTAWEAEALKARELGVRVVLLRIGVVLGNGGGAMAKMLTPFKFGLGGPLGSGEQLMSWIHIEDVARLIHAALIREDLSGPLNATAPEPVTNREFTKTLGKLLHRPALLPAPAFALRLLLGEMSEMLLTGQRVLPKKALEEGFAFKHPDLEGALRSVLV